jgi:tetraacyldisaccharide 4'-kinase
VNRLARYARSRGFIESKRLPVRTIGIGNIQAGGAGKTPLTIRLARDAIAEGLQVAVLLRGYRGAWEKTGGILSPHEPPPSPELCGDEAALIRDQAPGVWVGVGADRLTQFENLQSAANQRSVRQFDLVLLDDAFQHWKIECDQYVVAVTDAKFGERIFREDFSAIGPEVIVVLTKGEQLPPELMSHPRQIRARFKFAPADPAKRYSFVAAIGDPERARESLVRAGYNIVGMSVFPDHHAFTSLEVENILTEATATGTDILLSGKDWVKWRALGIERGLITVVEPEIEINEGESTWKSLVQG